MVVDDQHVVFAAAGGFEQVTDGVDLVFGVAQVEVLGAVLPADDVGSRGFMPAALCDAAADGELVFEGGGLGLLFGGNGGEDGEAEGHSILFFNFLMCSLYFGINLMFE